ncbi:uncharacterized protein EAF01_007128 [Botrytis porri]|uniref:uncharacterized protein n=1 Tax=Botrytis porri TaxID=87229 RepID=UPI0018FFE6CC|nr:uncharacterized protein EAF01_007128 [Botrytis porri]KAF7901830.1 hypothetical protein EAF01_007128 [Botrytis porri]
MSDDTNNEELILTRYFQDQFRVPTPGWCEEANLAFQTLQKLLDSSLAGPEEVLDSQDQGGIPSARRARIGALPKLVCFATESHAIQCTARNETLECVVFGKISASLFIDVFWEAIQKAQVEYPRSNSTHATAIQTSEWEALYTMSTTTSEPGQWFKDFNADSNIGSKTSTSIIALLQHSLSSVPEPNHVKLNAAERPDQECDDPIIASLSSGIGPKSFQGPRYQNYRENIMQIDFVYSGISSLECGKWLDMLGGRLKEMKSSLTILKSSSSPSPPTPPSMAPPPSRSRSR